MTRKRTTEKVYKKKVKQLVKFAHYKLRDLLDLKADSSAFQDQEVILRTFETACLSEHDKEVASVGCVPPCNGEEGGELSGRNKGEA